VIDLVVTQYFTYWRSVSLGSRDILEGAVAPEHSAPSPELARHLEEWNGHYYWESTPEGRWLVLIHESARPRDRWWLNVALLFLTLLATSIGGATLAGVNGLWYRPTIHEMLAGLPFSLPLLAILLAHESGHYAAARRYRVNASPPYFVPFPPQLNLLGTLGAFIRLRSPVFDRRTLFDIGAAGPIAGMLVALPVLLVGLARSTVERGVATLPWAHQYIVADDFRFFLGDSLLLRACRALLGLDGVLHLHPMAVAGWVGLLVTSLNLLPLTQFDGGHIAFALFGRAQSWIARVFWLALIPLGLLSRSWWVWAALALVLGRGRLDHPRLVSPERELDRTRRALGYLTIAIFLTTFMPLPIS
jgi:membrane-associated protease RseP (regulator of RpoE activity)